MFDVCIIGGGAAGLASAIAAARNGAKVKLLDKNKKAGKKLYATGNGKCNLTNLQLNIAEDYNSSNKTYINFLNVLLNDASSADVIQFMDSIGVCTYETPDGYVYPKSNQASAVVWALLDELGKYDVDCDFKADVESISKNNGTYDINTSNGRITASQVVLACGGKSYAPLGGSESGYNLAKSIGHTVIKPRPSLCGLHVDSDISSIAGVRAKACASLFINDQFIKKEIGEVQFTNEGISGIIIFNLSSQAGKAILDGEKVIICLDFLQNDTLDEIEKHIKNYANRSILGCLNGLINDKLASYILECNDINPKENVCNLTNKQIHQIIDTLKNLSFHVTSTYDFDNAQVCAGGVEISEINANTYESLIAPGVYIVGEMLDIDGKCGGYNLTFAFLSGLRAGEHIHVKN